ncbi:hypothetical protein [Salicibibacter kimchii]|uniref:Uncharacterized protein n=1 Tax=Salicibibacter kimchii TaxID=2099786 RepID=A0A345C195_9BACI|nr:hypothetical protein [Salicibibacter kimchii]AXF56976.1 hypothetical protein DT065_13840 [Salicibibacter kimchii]
MSDHLLKQILAKLDSQENEFKEFKKEMRERWTGLKDGFVGINEKVDRLDETLAYNTQMTEKTLEYAVHIDKHQHKNERYLTEKMVEHDKDIFHIKDKLKI